jgi:tetratricopeptide (TPR) repeat protein
MPPQAPPAAEAGPSKSKLALAGVGLVVAAGLASVVGYFGYSKFAATVVLPREPNPLKDPPKGNPYEALDAVYGAWKEPPPPPSCRRAEDAVSLAKVSTDVNALGLLVNPSPEAAYLLARSTFEQRGKRSPALDKALGCEGFAAAHFLAARVALKEAESVEGDEKEAKLEEASRRFAASTAANPKFLKPRLSRAVLLGREGRLEEALTEADGLVKADPDYGAAYLVRSGIYQQLSRMDDAKKDCQRAMKLGEEQAKAVCAPLLSQSP